MFYSIAFCPSWKCALILVYVLTLECLVLAAKVDIISSKFYDDKLIISCSVSSLTAEDVRGYKVYLYCPLVDHEKMCYIDCESYMGTDKGKPLYRDVFSSCENTWRLSNRFEFQYIINANNVNVVGQWYCAYKGQKSSNITIRQIQKVSSSHRPTTTSVTSTKASTQWSTTYHQTTIYQVQDIKLSTIGMYVMVLVSVLTNIILIVLLCRSQSEAKRMKKLMLTYNEERPPLLPKGMNRQIYRNHCLCSRTPSIESRSNKESSSIYFQEPSQSNSYQSPNSFDNQHPSAFSFMSHNNPYDQSIDRHNIFLLNNSHVNNLNDPTFDQGLHFKKFDLHRRSVQLPYSLNLKQHPSHAKVLNINGRTCFSHQQLQNDSNDDSGVGSDSLQNYNIQRSMTPMTGMDNVDLIIGCDPDHDVQSGKTHLNEEGFPNEHLGINEHCATLKYSVSMSATENT